MMPDYAWIMLHVSLTVLALVIIGSSVVARLAIRRSHVETMGYMELPHGTDTHVVDSQEAGIQVRHLAVGHSPSKAERRVRDIMTPSKDVAWVSIEDGQAEQMTDLRLARHGHVVVCSGSIESVLGVVRKQDLLDMYLCGYGINLSAAIMRPVVLPADMPLSMVLHRLGDHPSHMAIVVDGKGRLQGVVTRTDLLLALAKDVAVSAGII